MTHQYVGPIFLVYLVDKVIACRYFLKGGKRYRVDDTTVLHEPLYAAPSDLVIGINLEHKMVNKEYTEAPLYGVTEYIDEHDYNCLPEGK